ncbi:uncharacterized protein MYCFIDRAFT_190048 [Pseudocercospora fijiensis CIRAD86]|uniref:FAD-binding domain-containing protein n=1 Tax=Pseudocercospora fijiensis (strain CIRAD86) TaxID=383855 RepID=M2ZNM4_PSEFD|nr:uncharacterized protein MYCFIDRAFT_190048 [Pseudocercospora fijiensis CIRAD86]EME80694.1 hypothetical protein MYCFIDRAFT_190048 [Pseudocercospora fijiensis CIRAD86]
MAETQHHVLIVGAGITGLLLAQALKQVRTPFVVISRSRDLIIHFHAERHPWGVSLQWALPLIAECLPKEQFSRIHETAVDASYVPEDPGRFPTFHGKTGAHIKDIPLVYMYRVSRHKFRALCHEGIDVQYGKTLVGLKYPQAGSVVALFGDGSEITGTLVVGADGVRSSVRECIFDEVDRSLGLARTAPYIVISLHACYGDAEKALFVRRNHPVLFHGIHPDGFWLWLSVQDVPSDDPATWSFQLLITCKPRVGLDPSVEPITLARVQQMAESFGEPFRSAWRWVPPGTSPSSNYMSYWEPIPWNHREGRVTLAGDAAHAMTVQRGQGMNNGIADAVSLAKGLQRVVEGESSMEDTIEEYQREMIERGAAEVRLSKQQTEMVHDWNLALKSPLLNKEACFPQERTSHRL